MDDGVCVPAFGQHGEGDHTVHRLAEAACFAFHIHDLAKNLPVGDVFRPWLATRAGDFLAPEAFDLVRYVGSEVVIKGPARFMLLAID
jgi:hypothetical protein